jgi:hypothetical protein
MPRSKASILLPVGLAAALLVGACGVLPSGTPTPGATSTSIPTATAFDPCAPQNLAAQVEPIHRQMRAFDDAFALAASTTRDQLPDSIGELQALRRDAEERRPPACLLSLHEVSLVYMNTVIQTMLAFLTGVEDDAINQGLAQARQIHNQYMIEMARTVGTQPEGSAPPIAAATSLPAIAGTAGPTPNIVIATNNGPAGVDLRSTPSLDGQSVGVIEVGQQALAIGRSADGYWIMVEVPGLPGRVAWIYAALTQLSGPSEILPIVADLP